MISPTAGVTVARTAICLPPLSSETLGFDAVPLVTPTAAFRIFQLVDTCTPVSHVNALTSGTPRSGRRLPTEYSDNHPRPRIASSSSTLDGVLSARSDVRY